MKRRTGTEKQDQRKQELDPNIMMNDEGKSESMFSTALMDLSFNDRSAIEEEIHGVSCMAIEETPELIEESLALFDMQVDNIDHKPGYVKSQEILMENSSTHTNCWLERKEYKLRFLRAELFDAEKAAARFVKCLDFLLEVYGEYSLRRPIRMTDMNREEMAFLREGQYQLLPYRDRSGRRMYVIVVNNRRDIPRRVLLKVFFYLWFVLSGGTDIAKYGINDLETQRKGAITIVIPSHAHMEYEDNTNALQKIKFLRTRGAANATVAEVIPLRIVAIHICLPKTSLTQLIALNFATTLKKWNSRTKVHLGNHVELRYQLQGYGIPTELIPSTDSGNIKSVNLKQWMKLRKHYELEEQEWMEKTGIPYSSDSDGGGYLNDAESVASSYMEAPMINIVECPSSSDVVFRRGRSMNYHPGNVMFQNLIELRIQEHTIELNTTQARRQAIEMELIEEVRNNGGRFLKWDIDKSWWVNIDMQAEAEKEIVSKVHYAFRDFRKKMQKTHQEVIVTTSSTLAFVKQDGQKRTRVSDCKSQSSSDSQSDENMRCYGNGCGYLFMTDSGSVLI